MDGVAPVEKIEGNRVHLDLLAQDRP